jgi:hypothetical protein
MYCFWGKIYIKQLFALIQYRNMRQSYEIWQRVTENGNTYSSIWRIDILSRTLTGISSWDDGYSLVPLSTKNTWRCYSAQPCFVPQQQRASQHTAEGLSGTQTATDNSVSSFHTTLPIKHSGCFVFAAYIKLFNTVVKMKPSSIIKP